MQGLTKEQILETVEKLRPALDELIPGRWYVGGSAGLLIRDISLDRPVEDIDIVICGWKPDEDHGDMLNPFHYGTEWHKAIVGPEWTYAKSHSREHNGIRIISGRRDGVLVDILIKIKEFPKDIVKDIILEKSLVLKYYNDQYKRDSWYRGTKDRDMTKHECDLKWLKSKYNLY